MAELETDKATDYYNSIAGIFNSKRGGDVSNIKSLRPGMSASDGTVFLPDTIGRDSSALVKAMALIAKKLGLSVRLLPYGERSYKDVAMETWKISAGISFVVLDNDRKIAIKSKSDPYEHGRTIARAQQAIALFNSDKNVTKEAMRRSHRWFGNNPNEMEGSGRNKAPVKYTGRDLHLLFGEEEWSHEMASLLLQLLHRSHEFLSKEVADDLWVDCVEPYSSCVARFMERSRVVTPATGRKAAVTKKAIPRLPKENPLMTRNEMTFLQERLKPLFKADAPHDNNEWIKRIKELSWKDVRSSMEGNAIARDGVLKAFANVTTKRLQAIRKLPGSTANLRKVDVNAARVKALIVHRGAKAADDYAAELATLDPNGKHIWKEVLKLGLKNWGVSGNAEAIRSNLKYALDKFDVYSDISEIKPVPKSADDSGASSTKPTGKVPLTGAIANRLNEWLPLNPSEIIRNHVTLAFDSGEFTTVQEINCYIKRLESLQKIDKFSKSVKSQQNAILTDQLKKWRISGKLEDSPSL